MANLERIQRFNKVQFPDVRDCILRLIEEYSFSISSTGTSKDLLMETCFKKLDAVVSIMANYSNDKIRTLIEHTDIEIDDNQIDIKKLYKKLLQTWTAGNEFYTLFDVIKGRDIYIDQRIEAASGISVENFRTTTPDAAVPETSIYYADDIYSTMRFALVGYSMLTISGLKWRSFQDCYIARFRINSRFSRHKELQKRPYFVMEKRCYFGYDPTEATAPHPNYHLDRYTVHSDLEIDYASRSFVTDPAHNDYVNAFSYFYNAFLIGLNPKYLLLLDERLRHDRYKALANAINLKASQYGVSGILFEEHQVADYFSKTIRSKIELAMREWNKVIVRVESDQDAVNCACALGLVPLTPKVREVIFKLLR